MLAQLINKEETSILGFDSEGPKAGVEFPRPIQLIVQNLGEGTEADLARGTFTSLMELLTELQGVESDPSEGLIEVSVAAFSSVHGKALDLASHIENEVLLFDETSRSPGSALLDVSFALRHELRRAFDLDIADIDGERPFETAEGRVAHAHFVLRNCFRQCVVLLAQEFDASLSEREVFADAASRREESIILRDALASLLTSVQGAVKKSFPQSAVSVIEHLDVFRREERRYLMRRDWEMFDAFENDIVAAKDADEFEITAKEILVGLETLLGQVRMRAAFNTEAPAEPAPRRFHAGLLSALTGRMSPALWSAGVASLIVACALAFFADTTLEIRGSQTAAAPRAGSVPHQTISRETEQAEAGPKEFTEPTEPAESKPAQHEKSGDGLTLQVGAFRDNSAALENAARLKMLGVEARVAEAQKGGQVIYRVQVGNFASSVDAAHFGSRLRAKGIAQSFIITKAG